MRTAVVIPVKNEAEGLQDLIDRLAGQIQSDDEVIFVDAGSADRTQAIIQQAASHDPRIRLIVSPGAYCGFGRNVGIRATTADIIALIDGGNLPDENWLPRLTAPLLRGEADYVWGTCRFQPVVKHVLGCAFDMAEVYGCSLHRGSDASLAMHGGACIAYRRWVWEKAGGYADWAMVREDTLFVKRVQALGVRARLVADASMQWQIGPRIRDIVRRQIKDQKMKLLFSHAIFKSHGFVHTPLLILAMLLPAAVFPGTLLITGPALLLHWFRQTWKTARVYRTRQPNVRQRLLLGLPLILLLEWTAIFAKIVGTLQGLLHLRYAREVAQKTTVYLQGPATGANPLP